MIHARTRLPLLPLILVSGLALSVPPEVAGVPYFARKHEVSCSRCHVIPPKLNELGEDYVASGYDSPELIRSTTYPFALWVSGRTESRPVSEGDREEISPFVNRVELISGGRLGRPWLAYFIEWRLVSQETRSDGSLRDRSGRLEDAFLVASPGDHLAVTVGQFRQIDQVDVSRRLSLSEPLVLSASLPGEGGATTRRQALRAFSPSGRSPAIRVAWNDRLHSGRHWTLSATVSMPGELSIPLTSEARREASFEVEPRVKGMVLEGFTRRGLASLGGHLFYDDSDRWLLNGIATGRRRAFFWTAMAGLDRVEGTHRTRWSLEWEYVPGPRWGIGARFEERIRDGADPALLPYVTWHLPLRPASRLTVTFEQRIQRDHNASLLELGLLF